MSTEEPMSIEDRIRTATRAGATVVRDIGPLAAQEPSRLRRRPAPAARRWSTWGIPLAAAAAVVLVAVGLVAVRTLSSRAPSTGGPAITPSATVPRYYVALDEVTGWTGTPDSGALIVGDDLTGKAIATVNPPHGVHFDSVQGASDDRTFVVMTSRQATPESAPDTWYLLRIAPGTAHPYQMAKLPIKLPGSSPDGVAYALSPDDRELAVESLGHVSSSGAVTTVALYSVSSGAELRSWTTDTNIASGPGQDTLSWLPDSRQLAYSAFLPGHNMSSHYLQIQLRTLDVTGSGTDLMTASRALLTVRTPISSPSYCWAMRLTPDGGTVICGTQYAYLTGGAGTNAGCANGGLEFAAYSVRTAKPVRVVYQYRGTCTNGSSSVLWADSSATYIIGATEVNLSQGSGKQGGQLGVISDGHIRLLKLPKTLPPSDFGTVAF